MKKVLIVVIIFIAACGEAFAGSLTVGLFDLSGSVLTDITGSEGKDSPFAKNLAEAEKDINRLDRGDALILIGFAKHDVILLKATMPKQAGPMKSNFFAFREAAVKKLKENLTAKAASVDNSGTDVIGGIYRASRLFEEASDMSEKKLIVYSDLLDNENIGLSLKRLKKVGSHKDFLRKLEGRKAGYPNLKNVEVDLFSMFSDIKGINTVETEIAIKELKALWIEYFNRCGANVKSFKTNY